MSRNFVTEFFTESKRTKYKIKKIDKGFYFDLQAIGFVLRDIWKGRSEAVRGHI
jgi:hypothetical protein